MVASSVQPGDLVAGKYRVERVLGAGGMGVVVAAMHVDLEQRVAIKLLIAHTAEHAERLLREARAAVRLRSEHAAKVLDVGRLDDGTPFLVLEYLEGRDLDEVLTAEGPLAPRRVAGYLVQACEALAEAHSLGIIHRDLKPQNLFLLKGIAGEDVVKVLDFGIAKTAGFREESSLTGEQSLMGSPVYMPPEQMRSARNVLPQGDVWALGVTLQELLTGRVPFEGTSLSELCLNVVGGEPRSPLLDRPDLPAEMVGIIARCLSRDPAQRYAHAGELATALESLAPPESSFSASRARLLTGMRSSLAFEATLEADTPASVRAPSARSATLDPAILTGSRSPTPASLRPFASSPVPGFPAFAEPSTETSFPGSSATTPDAPALGPSVGSSGHAAAKTGKLVAVAAAAALLAAFGWFLVRDQRGAAPLATSPTVDVAIGAATAPLPAASAVPPPSPLPAPPATTGEPAPVAPASTSAKTASPPVSPALQPPPATAAPPGPPGDSGGTKTNKQPPKRPPTHAGDDIPSMR